MNQRLSHLSSRFKSTWLPTLLCLALASLLSACNVSDAPIGLSPVGGDSSPGGPPGFGGPLPSSPGGLFNPGKWLDAMSNSKDFQIKQANELLSLAYDPFLIKIPADIPEPPSNPGISPVNNDPQDSTPTDTGESLWDSVQLVGISYNDANALAIVDFGQGSEFISSGEELLINGRHVRVLSIEEESVTLELDEPRPNESKQFSPSIISIVTYEHQNDSSNATGSNPSANTSDNSSSSEPSNPLQDILNQLGSIAN